VVSNARHDIQLERKAPVTDAWVFSWLDNTL
jgi:hypothetical protein